MPMVPVTRLSEEMYGDKPVKSVSPAPAHAHPAESVRWELATAVRQEVLRQGSVSTDFLDRFAVSHGTADLTDTPAGWDYAALRRATQYEENAALQDQQRDRVQQEAAWVSQVGAVLPDSISLKTYLSLQIPAYQTRLEQMGFSSQQAAQQAAHLQQETVEKHLSQTLSRGDWQTAQEVLAQQEKVLPAESRAAYARRARSVFAHSQARRIWQQALQQMPDANQARAYALEHLDEPDEELREQVQAQIGQLAAEQNRKTAANKAEVCNRLAQAQADQAEQVLYTQRVFDGDELALLHRAVERLTQPATPAQQVWFVKNYLNVSAQVPEAFAQGRCSARDYLRLQAVQYRRQSGQDISGEEWLLRGIGRWMHQQGFAEKDVFQVSYAVLKGKEGQEQIHIWQKIKTLLTC